MKTILPLVFLFIAPSGFAQGLPDNFASTQGVLTSSEVHGDWFFSEIRELNGKLSGCFASTTPFHGNFSFETAELNLLSYREGPAVLEKIGINDVAVPGATGWQDAIFLKSDAESRGRNMSAYVAHFINFPDPVDGRFTVMTEASDRALDYLRAGSQAALSFIDQRDPIYYSLRGSSAAISRWQDCTSSL